MPASIVARRIPEVNDQDAERIQVLDVSSTSLERLPVSIAQLSSLRRLDCSRNLLEKFSSTIKNCGLLRELILAHNQLKSLPDCIGCLKQLYVLDVSYNQLRTLPCSLHELSRLRILDIKCNLIEDIIKEAYGDGIVHLRSLLKACEHHGIPPEDLIARYDNLIAVQTNQRMYGSQMKVESIDASFLDAIKTDGVVHLENLGLHSISLIRSQIWTHESCHLQTLVLSNNQIEELPLLFWHSPVLRSLRRLELDRNSLTEIHEDIVELQHLEDLVLSNNKLQQLPISLVDISGLRFLNVSYNQLKRIPLEIECKPNLHLLRAGNPPDRTSPYAEEISTLKKQWTYIPKHSSSNLSKDRANSVLVSVKQRLQRENLDFPDLPKQQKRIMYYREHSDLVLFPREIFSPGKLMDIDLSHNHIKEIPNNIRRLLHLRRLSLHHNEITSDGIPADIYMCQKLQDIDLSYNQLVELREIALVPSLRILNVSCNRIQILSEAIARLPKLESLLLIGNRDIPVDLLDTAKRGREALAAYFNISPRLGLEASKADTSNQYKCS